MARVVDDKDHGRESGPLLVAPNVFQELAAKGFVAPTRASDFRLDGDRAFHYPIDEREGTSVLGGRVFRAHVVKVGPKHSANEELQVILVFDLEPRVAITRLLHCAYGMADQRGHSHYLWQRIRVRFDPLAARFDLPHKTKQQPHELLRRDVLTVC